jgi:putative membrane protein
MPPTNTLSLAGLFRNSVILLLGVFLATGLMDSIHADSTATLVTVAIVLTLLNLVVKPLLILFTLPFVILSMGLGLFVINALLLLLASRLIDGFHVDGFLSALLASLLISALSLLVNLLLGNKPALNVKVNVSTNRSSRSPSNRRIDDKNDAIDV